MSFAPEFTPDALSQWKALDFYPQELVLDAIEELASSPPDAEESIIDMEYNDAGIRHCIFLHAWLDHGRKKVLIVGVGDHVRR